MLYKYSYTIVCIASVFIPLCSVDLDAVSYYLMKTNDIWHYAYGFKSEIVCRNISRALIFKNQGT